LKKNRRVLTEVRQCGSPIASFSCSNINAALFALAKYCGCAIICVDYPPQPFGLRLLSKNVKIDKKTLI